MAVSPPSGVLSPAQIAVLQQIRALRQAPPRPQATAEDRPAPAPAPAASPPARPRGRGQIINITA